MSYQKPRLSGPILRMLRLLLEKPREGRSGAEISKLAKVGAGTLYPALARLERMGWLISEWEQVDPREVGRPRRRFHKLSGTGHRNAYAALAELQMPNGELVWTH